MNKRKHCGFTLVELLYVLAILAVLTALLMPIIMTARRRAKSSACLSNTRQWGSAMLTYIQDYDGSYPPALTATFVNSDAPGGGIGWYTLLQPYTGTAVFLCPSRQVSSAYASWIYTCGYAFNVELNDSIRRANTLNYEGKHEATIPIQATTITVFDARAGILASDVPDTGDPHEVFGIYSRNMEREILADTPGAIRHNGGANYGFADGHAKWLRPDGIATHCDGTKPCFTP